MELPARPAALRTEHAFARMNGWHSQCLPGSQVMTTVGQSSSSEASSSSSRWTSSAGTTSHSTSNLVVTTSSTTTILGGASTTARVIMVPSDGRLRHFLYMDRDIFLGLFESTGLDESGLYLYLISIPGLHSLGITGTESPVFCFFLNTIEYTLLLWTYDAQRCATNFILIGEAGVPSKTKQLLEVIKRAQDITIFQPLYLAFLACSQGFLMTCEDRNASTQPSAVALPAETMELCPNSSKVLKLLEHVLVLRVFSIIADSDESNESRNDVRYQSTLEIQTAVLSLRFPTRQPHCLLGSSHPLGRGQLTFGKTHLAEYISKPFFIALVAPCMLNSVATKKVAGKKTMVVKVFNTRVRLSRLARQASVVRMHQAMVRLQILVLGVCWSVLVLLCWDETMGKVVQPRELAAVMERKILLL
ncbi:hypothetical protein VTI74DRAFT_7907 [Chaetomium olivicolor]